MELDLTPRKYRKKAVQKRRRAPRAFRNWDNPFQLIIAAVAVLAFVGTTIVERIQDQNDYADLFNRASGLAVEVEKMHEEVLALYAERKAVRAGNILKEQTAGEQDLDSRIDELMLQLDERFMLINQCFIKMPSRYRSKINIQQWFIDISRDCIDVALEQSNYEQARRWFNAAALNFLMTDTRVRVEGKGRLELDAGDNIEEVVVIPVKSDGPRLVPCDPLRKTSEFPLIIPDIEKGSYLIWATRNNGTFFIYPLYMAHGEERALHLRTPAANPDGMVYVPSGTFYCGGEESPVYRFHKRELPAYYIKKKEVTVDEYLQFWRELPTDRKSRYMSHIRIDEEGPLFDAWDADGQLMNDLLSVGHPVVGISHDAASAYCEWLSGRLGREVRLPTAFEWEKAARGVDGRTYPWGFGFQPEADLALSLANPKGKSKYPLWAPPGSFRRDVSVYGALDMAGNVREMTATPWPGAEETFQIKGGSASTPSAYLACAYVSGLEAVPSDIGFRYIMPVQGEGL